MSLDLDFLLRHLLHCDERNVRVEGLSVDRIDLILWLEASKKLRSTESLLAQALDAYAVTQAQLAESKVHGVL